MKVFSGLPNERKQRHGGFLLLEALLSVLIVTVGIVFVLGSFVTSLKTVKVTEAYYKMMYMIENRMWQYDDKMEIEPGSGSGEAEFVEGGEWEYEAEELEELPLSEFNMEVRLKEGGGERRLAVTTYLNTAEGIF